MIFGRFLKNLSKVKSPAKHSNTNGLIIGDISFIFFEVSE